MKTANPTDTHKTLALAAFSRPLGFTENRQYIKAHSRQDFLDACALMYDNMDHFARLAELHNVGCDGWINLSGQSEGDLMRLISSGPTPEHLKEEVQEFIRNGPNQKQTPPPRPKTHLYVMLNKRNGLFKIGRSTNPQHREKTLQSEEPEIELLHAWTGDYTGETILHNKYAAKRVRGEWFRLTITDLVEILGNDIVVRLGLDSRLARAA